MGGLGKLLLCWIIVTGVGVAGACMIREALNGMSNLGVELLAAADYCSELLLTLAPPLTTILPLGSSVDRPMTIGVPMSSSTNLVRVSNGVGHIQCKSQEHAAKCTTRACVCQPRVASRFSKGSKLYRQAVTGM